MSFVYQVVVIILGAPPVPAPSTASSTCVAHRGTASSAPTSVNERLICAVHDRVGSNDLVSFFCQLQLISSINCLAAAAGSHSSGLHFSICCSPANNCNLLALTFRNILIAAADWRYL
jgi:hypothetical protein